ncbi:MAG TPA: TetR/AcrR family transcriptional regulator [Acidimicrobiia bacterium]|jgi:AcrR family transcriptional regulator|nr:TetR/AcrR family transcriptional regulator [Acidimicrobiia bacterium]
MVGRPRSTEADHAILDAAIIEYGKGGLEGLNVDAVAARAGVSKATIYRRYPSKVDLVIAAAQLMCEENAPDLDTGTVRGDLLATLRNLRRMLEDPVLGAAKRMLVMDALQNDELRSMHAGLVATRRQHTLEMLHAAAARGELRDDIDLEFATDQIGAPVFYRHLLMHEKVTDAYIDQVVEAFVERYCVAAAVVEVAGRS